MDFLFTSTQGTKTKYFRKLGVLIIRLRDKETFFPFVLSGSRRLNLIHVKVYLGHLIWPFILPHGLFLLLNSKAGRLVVVGTH